MREIKFKAFIKEIKEIHDVSSLNFVDSEVFSIYVRSTEDVYYDYKNEFELIRYTGLKDKNGCEIYEGDIIEVECIEDEVKTLHQVIWGGNEYPAWDVKPKWDSECNVFSDICCSGYYKMKVIGNIYENKELLTD